jgi:hypothetical protein
VSEHRGGTRFALASDDEQRSVSVSEPTLLAAKGKPASYVKYVRDRSTRRRAQDGQARHASERIGSCTLVYSAGSAVL